MRGCAIQQPQEGREGQCAPKPPCKNPNQDRRRESGGDHQNSEDHRKNFHASNIGAARERFNKRAPIMATKRIQTELSIKAVDMYSGKLREMRTVTGRFADGVRTEMGRLQKMRGPLKLIEDFRKQQQVVGKSGEALDRARERVRQLQHAITTTRQPTVQMRREFDRARSTAGRLEEQHQRNRRALSGLRGQLRETGVNMGDLSGEERRLAGSVDRATTAFGRQVERMQRVETMQKRIAQGRERMDRSLARAANLTIAGHASMQSGRRILTGLSGVVQQAVAFESSMSDVRKVVNFDTPDGLSKMSDDILTMSTHIPVAADGLAQIVAAGGQSGIATKDLSEFAEMAAKIGVAFDISADQSGEAMAKIKTALGLSLDETGSLFDAMNHLSNNMAATAPDVLNFTKRVAVDGAVKGFSPTQTMAFGTAMIAAGAEADVAATSFRNMGKALARGESATKRQRAAFSELGLNATKVAKSMQKDAVGTTIDVMERINTLPKHLQASVTSDLFGDEARALAPLINNLDLLRESVGLVSDKQKYAGSAEKEYAARAQTTANNLQLMRNQMNRLGVTIGDAVLPPLNDLLKSVTPIVESITQWAKAHKPLVKWFACGHGGGRWSGRCGRDALDRCWRADRHDGHPALRARGAQCTRCLCGGGSAGPGRRVSGLVAPAETCVLDAHHAAALDRATAAELCAGLGAFRGVSDGGKCGDGRACHIGRDEVETDRAQPVGYSLEGVFCRNDGLLGHEEPAEGSQRPACVSGQEP